MSSGDAVYHHAMYRKEMRVIVRVSGIAFSGCIECSPGLRFSRENAHR
jgi:hypothetical protein